MDAMDDTEPVVSTSQATAEAGPDAPSLEEVDTEVDAGQDKARAEAGSAAEASTSDAAECVAQPGGGTTAFFVFSAVHRVTVREELQAQSEEGAKVKIGDIAKRIGELWRALSEEERAVYVKQAAENKAHKKANPVVVEEDAASDAHATLPISLVKKVMVLGQDGKGRCTADGVKCMARAAELFLGALARRAGDEAQGSARATVNFRDIEASLSNWKPTAWPESPFLEIENEAQHQAAPQQSKALKEAAQKTHKINSFFTKKKPVEQPAEIVEAMET